MYSENAKPVYPTTPIPYRYRRIKMPRFRVHASDGSPVSALLKIWSHMPYTAGEMRTGYYGEFDDYYYHGNKFKLVHTEPFEWCGCPEAAIKTLEVFWGRNHFGRCNKDFEDTLLYSNLTHFLQVNGALTIQKIPNEENYRITSRALKKVNPIFNRNRYHLSQRYKNFNPCTENGFFFIPRAFTDKLLPSYTNSDPEHSYITHNLQFTALDAYYDLYCNACFMDERVIGSQLGAIVAIDGNPIVSYASLGERWGWSKAKVLRFFREMKAKLTVISLGSNRGSVVYVNDFISDQSGWYEYDIIPTEEQVKALFLNIKPLVKDTKADEKTFTNLDPSMTIEKIAKKVLKKVGVAKELLSKAAYSLGRAFAMGVPIFFKTKPKYSKKSREHMLYGAYWDPNGNLVNLAPDRYLWDPNDRETVLAQEIYCQVLY